MDAASAPPAVEIRCPASEEARLRFAGDEIRAAGGSAPVSVILAAGAEACARTASELGVAPPATNAPEAYAIRRTGRSGRPVCAVLGADGGGAMYGGLDVAEALRLGRLDALRDGDRAPFIAKRGLKFNWPLDLRTPSYSDCGDSFQQNIPEVWSMEFWREFLDEMARDRYNVLTLWSLHPFPSLVRVPEYPDVALSDVWRTTMPLDDTFSHTGDDMVRPAMLARHEVVRRMTIEEKIRFWRAVMDLAHDRGVEVYLFTWNLFTFGAEPRHGLAPAPANAVTRDYFRRSVRELVLTYPRLAGIGITAGEQLPGTNAEREEWLSATYGEGIRDALARQPGRDFLLIHRCHMTGVRQILDAWRDAPCPMDLSFKYAIAHMYASPAPPFARGFLRDLPAGRRTWMTVRNDDIYSFRWGDPAFARAFIRNLPGPERLAGFYMGPDGYCWGREFIDTEPQSPRQLVMKKQWLSFALWGRLSYDPTLPDALFEHLLGHRCPEVPADRLLRASSAASRIIPQATRFFWGDIDLKWFPEACLSHPRHRGFYTVRHFMEGVTMPGSGLLNIRDYCDRRLAGRPIEGGTPPEAAAGLRRDAEETLRLTAELRPRQGANRELRLMLGDFEAMARLGLYYAAKIDGATALALFDRTGGDEHHLQAVRHLETARDEWQRYAALATAQYRPQLLNRVGFVDLHALASRVAEDIEIARGWKARDGIGNGRP